MSKISVIGVHTPAQADALQSATGMDMRIGRNGAYLAPKDKATRLLDMMDEYERTDRLAYLGDMGSFPEFAA
ncbi:MAG: hypothetical protein Q8O37_06670 [Sulfuricellaceae bacterium]|nr:hypothetical protein [Sulfuricellaceae bacterium]